jgi:hypothetical protein
MWSCPFPRREGIWGRRGIAPLVLNLGTRWGCDLLLKSRLTFGLKKFTFPSIFTHDLSSKKQTGVPVVAYYCNFTACKNDCWFVLLKLEHITQQFVYSRNAWRFQNSTWPAGRRFDLQVINCWSLVQINFGVFLWSWRHHCSFLHGAKYFSPLLFMKFWLTSMNFRFYFSPTEDVCWISFQ